MSVKILEKVDVKKLDALIKVLMRAFLSLGLLVVALVIILSGTYSEEATRWAYGLIGVVVGYWIK